MNLYSNIFAQFYDKLFGKNLSDFEFYKFFIQKNKGTALEIGSGTGRLLLKFLENGFDVEGIEPNKDMINICLQKSKKLKLEPIIYNQSIENLNLEKKYKTIFLPLFIFQHLEEKDSVTSLKNCINHLEKNGEILISIFSIHEPSVDQDWQLNTFFKSVNEEIKLFEMAYFDTKTKIQTKKLKFEHIKNKKKEIYFSEIQFQIYSIDELKEILKNAGFKNIEIFGDYSLQTADENSEILIFKGIKI